MSTKPEVFIVESLDLDDEENELHEGHILSKILAMSDKKCHYYYIRTKKELKHVLALFNESQYRYLHLSCHAGKERMSTTFDKIPFGALAKMLKGNIGHRRLFLSACWMARTELATAVLPETDFISIMGFDTKVYVPDAAVFWASFYHLMFTADSKRMNNDVLRSTTQALVNIHKLRLRYFAKDKALKTGFKPYTVEPKTQT
jgi:hypothetical protein